MCVTLICDQIISRDFFIHSQCVPVKINKHNLQVSGSMDVSASDLTDNASIGLTIASDRVSDAVYYAGGSASSFHSDSHEPPYPPVSFPVPAESVRVNRPLSNTSTVYARSAVPSASLMFLSRTSS